MDKENHFIKCIDLKSSKWDERSAVELCQCLGALHVVFVESKQNESLSA